MQDKKIVSDDELSLKYVIWNVSAISRITCYSKLVSGHFTSWFGSGKISIRDHNMFNWNCEDQRNRGNNGTIQTRMDGTTMKHCINTTNIKYMMTK